MERTIVDKIVKSKIVCTLGPATSSEQALKQLVAEGCDIVRLNFSHASVDGKEMIELFQRIRNIVPQVGILCDIQGPKIRIGEMKEPVTLEYGKEFTLYENPIIGDQEKASISYKGFIKDMKVNDYIFINDGLVRLQIIEKNVAKGYVKTKILAGGTISSKKGVNIPAGQLSMKVPTEKDVHDLKLISKLHPEYVAVSFIGSAQDVKEIRLILDNYGGEKIKIISKIERPIAITNFDEILEKSDGIMVARGDLGVEIPAEDVPIRQKEMILKCNQTSKPVIVATQMLESMINNSVPTRAEVNDVFNAVYDRADAVMLSGETSVGKFPFNAVQYMDKIINKAEKYIPSLDPTVVDSPEPEMYESTGHAIYELANVFDRVNFRGKIIVFTRGGKSARMIAKYRPKFPIIALTHDALTVRQLKLVWGVIPLYFPNLNFENWHVEEMIQNGIQKLVQYNFVEMNEHVICTVPSRFSPVRCSIIGSYYVKDILHNIEIKPEQYNPTWPKE